MLVDHVPGIHARVELVVPALLELPAVQDVQSALGKGHLSIGRLAHDVDHATGHCPEDRLVVGQKLGIRLAGQGVLHRQVGHRHNRDLLIREGVFLHANHGVADPGGHDGLQLIGAINVVEAPVFIGHHPLAQVIPERHPGVDPAGMVGHIQGLVRGPVHLVEVLVAPVLQELCLRGLEAHDGKVRLGDVTLGGRVDEDVLVMQDLQGRLVLDHDLLLDLGGSDLVGEGRGAGLLPVVHRLPDLFRQLLEPLRIGAL